MQFPAISARQAVSLSFREVPEAASGKTSNVPWRRGFLPLKSELESLSRQLQQNMDQRDVMEVRHPHTARTQSRDDCRGQESSLKAAKTERNKSINSSQIYQLVSPSTSSGMSE